MTRSTSTGSVLLFSHEVLQDTRGKSRDAVSGIGQAFEILLAGSSPPLPIHKYIKENGEKRRIVCETLG
jgi:hypothetical protein